MSKSTTRVFSVMAPNTPGDNPVLFAQGWCHVVITKESSGAVIMGTEAALAPIAGGRGLLLPADTPIHMILAPGTNIYLYSDATTQRVTFVVTELGALLEMLMGAFGGRQ